jgi:DNA-binding NarL/FixJ family response regulator
MNRPKIAIIDANTLATLGLKQMLQTVMPIMTVDTFGSFTELEANHPEQYFHFFVSMHIVLENMSFFLDHRRKTIVLSTLNSQLSTLNSPLDPKGRFPQKELSTPNSQLPTPNSPLSHFHSLCINVPESELVRSLLMLEQHAHGHGQNLPPMPKALQQKILSDREIEVMSLIVQGFINKEIADKLNIGLSTVITHRKNIMDKLGLKSVSALTIYAVTHGYVDINTI